jgi:hypothetical protein
VNVGLGAVDGAPSGKAVFTNGLASCIAVVVRDTDAEHDDNDKILAHISSTMCSGGDPPHIDDQLQALYDKDDTSSPEVLVIVAPDNGNGAQKAFNNYVLNACQNNWDGATVRLITRDQSHVNEDGGSRLWVDGQKNVYWGVAGTQIA